jgi:hypothetical protein
VGGSECSVAILDQAFDSNTGTAVIMAAGPPQAPWGGPPWIAWHGPPQLLSAGLSDFQLEGGGAAWRVPKAKREERWEAGLNDYKKSKTHNVLTQAMDTIAKLDVERGYAYKTKAAQRDICEEASKPKAEGGTGFISRSQRCMEDSAQRHGRARHHLEDFLSTTLRGEAMFGHLLLQSAEEIERLRGAQPMPRRPLYKMGQSVFQWWAPWMCKAPLNELPGTYAGRKRPAWFKAEVLAVMPEPVDIVYSGILYKLVFTYRAH